MERFEVAFLPVDMIELLIEQVGPLLQSLLLLADLPAHRISLDLDLLPAAQGLFLAGQVGLPTDGLRLAMGLGDDLFGHPARNKP